MKENEIVKEVKVKRGKAISSISEFDQSCAKYYVVAFGKQKKDVQVLKRSFLMSMVYRALFQYIIEGRVYEADRIIMAPSDKDE